MSTVVAGTEGPVHMKKGWRTLLIWGVRYHKTAASYQDYPAVVVKVWPLDQQHCHRQGTLVAMQITQPCPRPTESEALEVGAQPRVHKLSREFGPGLRFDNQCFGPGPLAIESRRASPG